MNLVQVQEERCIGSEKEKEEIHKNFVQEQMWH